MPSSAIRSFGYDRAARKLRITFVTGRQYAYEAVPPDVFAKFEAAPSRGRFFNLEIRDRYSFSDETPETTDWSLRKREPRNR